MAKSICLYFQVHQPTRLRLYRFFDIGKDSHYYDDFANRTILKRVAQKCYLPMNKTLLKAIKASNGSFKVAFSISGSALEQFDRYAPEVLESFKELAETGCVEFLCETYYHSLASIGSPLEFEYQIFKHKEAIKHYFGVEPVTFRNTELIYSDAIGKQVYDMGFKTILTEGARHIMGWRCPNYVYSNDFVSEQSLLLRNYALSDDIAFRFGDRNWSGWPLTAEKFKGWIDEAEGDYVGLFMDYEPSASTRTLLPASLTLWQRFRANALRIRSSSSILHLRWRLRSSLYRNSLFLMPSLGPTKSVTSRLG